MYTWPGHGDIGLYCPVFSQRTYLCSVMFIEIFVVGGGGIEYIYVEPGSPLPYGQGTGEPLRHTPPKPNQLGLIKGRFS